MEVPRNIIIVPIIFFLRMEPSLCGPKVATGQTVPQVFCFVISIVDVNVIVVWRCTVYVDKTLHLFNNLQSKMAKNSFLLKLL